MKATGQLVFTRNANGTISKKWSGGSRIVISNDLIKALTGEYGRMGQVIALPDVSLRLITYHLSESQGYRDGFIAMREGLLARLIWQYWQWLSDHALMLFKWECKWLRKRDPVESEAYPKWSLPGILLRPLI